MRRGPVGARDAPTLFMLAEFGRHGDFWAKLSACDVQRGSRALVDTINAESRGLTREGTREMVRAAADKILRRHGLVGPNAGGWCAGAS